MSSANILSFRFLAETRISLQFSAIRGISRFFFIDGCRYVKAPRKRSVEDSCLLVIFFSVKEEQQRKLELGIPVFIWAAANEKDVKWPSRAFV